MRQKIIIILSTVLITFNMLGQQTDSLHIDSTLIVQSVSSVNNNQPSNSQISEADLFMSLPIVQKLPDWLSNYLSSLLSGHVDRTREKTVDVTFGALPSYTREAGFGIGAVATGLYRANRNDTLPNPSDFYASINASLNGFYVLTFQGNHLFPDNKSRLSYKTEIYSKNLDFWGITAQETAKNPKSKYNRRQLDLQAEYIYKINRNFYAGAQLRCNYTDAVDIDNHEYMLGERNQYYVTGLGLSFEFDTRDNLVTPTRGVHLAYKPMIYPQFIGNAHTTFHSHTFIANYYQKLWKGSILAFDFYTTLNSKNTPWTMREMMASDGVRMRGYYMGSTIDNNQIAGQIELRQHIWYRIGATAWIGTASLFSSLNEFKHSETMPYWQYNYGVGLRIEFKHNVNARIDLGFGKNTKGVLFAIGEAF